MEEIVELLKFRSPLYAEVAELIVDTDDQEPTSVVAEILAKLGVSPVNGAKADAGDSP